MNEQIRPSIQPRRTAHRPGPRVVVVAFDGTDSSSHALAYAAGLAERTDAHLLVVTVDPLSPALGYPPADPALIEWVNRAVADVIGAARCRYEVSTLTGNPAIMIESIAQARHADVLVVGRPRHPLMHPLGSVPAQLARRAERPVLVVP